MQSDKTINKKKSNLKLSPKGEELWNEIKKLSQDAIETSRKIRVKEEKIKKLKDL